MSRTYLDFLEDIAEAMKKAQSFVEGMGYPVFVQDEKTNFATVRAIEIIGEATKHIPDEVQNRFPEIPWRNMARMRDRVMHAYFGVDLQIVWDTITVEIRQTLPAIQRVLEILEGEET